MQACVSCAALDPGADIFRLDSRNGTHHLSWARSRHPTARCGALASQATLRSARSLGNTSLLPRLALLLLSVVARGAVPARPSRHRMGAVLSGRPEPIMLSTEDGQKSPEEIVAQMTLEQKLGQIFQVDWRSLRSSAIVDALPLSWAQPMLSQVTGNAPLTESSAPVKAAFTEGCLASVLGGGGAHPDPNAPHAWREQAEALQRAADRSALGRAELSPRMRSHEGSLASVMIAAETERGWAETWAHLRARTVNRVTETVSHGSIGRLLGLPGMVDPPERQMALTNMMYRSRSQSTLYKPSFPSPMLNRRRATTAGRPPHPRTPPPSISVEVKSKALHGEG